MKRGDVYWADLAPRSGSQQTGRRPVIVMSHDGFNQAENWRSVIVVPMTTSQTQARRAATTVPIQSRVSGLDADGTAICHQITTLDRSKLSRQTGSLPPSVLESIELAIKAALDID